MATLLIQVRRGNTWVTLDPSDVRWEVTEEIAEQCAAGQTSGTIECGGQTYRWQPQD